MSPAAAIPATIFGISLSLLSSLLSALGMNLQAAQALIEQTVNVEKSPGSPAADRWRKRFGRSFSRRFSMAPTLPASPTSSGGREADGSDHWLYADIGEANETHVREPEHETGQQELGAEGYPSSGSASRKDSQRLLQWNDDSEREATETDPLLPSPSYHDAALPPARPRRIPTLVEQEIVLETVPLPAGTVFWKRIWGAWMWHAGLALYILGTAVGGSLALCFISPLLIAPLSSASLVFNIFFSAWLLGTDIGLHDYVGTAFLVVGSVMCGIWGGGEGAVTTPDTLPKLFDSHLFVALFATQCAIALAIFVPLVIMESIRSPRGILNRHIWVPWLAPKIEQTGALAYAEEQDGWIDAWIDAEKEDARDKQSEAKEQERKQGVRLGMGYALVGGLVASLSLLITKSGVDLAITGFLHPEPGAPPLSLGLLLPLILALPATLLVQLYALHRSLDLAPPLVSVPLFFASYTLPQLPDQVVINLVILERIGYTEVALGLVAGGMAAVVIGVGVLARGGNVS